ncbi:sorbosone dehydrogenase family protein [Taibaiella lutea]|uniref:Sorbosone dehydrogenase family protein n=1 Tax=Taibaiella lutea TaxID=2608001 RepID=A0A5M6CFB1_9BACT|nr:sorbosone dehydrogenase family protein [Taibaiella lutea]KAA5532135.1 sorbosone dehydrogenase family protein [Taibaiella lutea]
MKWKISSVILFTSVAAFAQKEQKALHLPEPFATKSVNNYSHVLGWENNLTPQAPKGFTVTKYADGFDNPRWTCETPNKDVLVVESNSNYNFVEQIGANIIGAGHSNNLKHSADRIMILKDLNHDGIAEQKDTFLTGLNQPFGMLFLGNWFYVANTDALWRYQYDKTTMQLKGAGEKIIDLPSGKYNKHWSRNLIASKKGDKIYIAVGSGSNIGEHGMENEILRAAILEVNPDGSGMRVYASGLRNPVGMGWAPGTNTLWTVVNERDGLGDDLVPDYFTSVKENGFYGWPYVYLGQHTDPRVKESNPQLVDKTIVPDVPLVSHTATLGLMFYTGAAFPAKYRNGAFLAQHGSFNRSVISGYKVLFVPFKNGKPSGKPEDFLTGFVANEEKEEVYGRPVGLTQLSDGSVLLTDDVSNTVWRITYK